jgi:hypothetical protein
MSESSLRRSIERREGELKELRVRVENLREGLAQAHNELHANDVEACHERLHEAMHADGETTLRKVTYRADPMAQGNDFDTGFRLLCQHHRVDAAYVVAEQNRLLKYKHRMITGGTAKVVQYLHQLMGKQNA